jgi:hypothetical protein
LIVEAWIIAVNALLDLRLLSSMVCDYMEILRAIITWLTALSGVVAGVFWIKAARARADAPSETKGVGALLGGYLISQDAKGRYDLHKTLEAQAKWNAWAAYAATAAAILAVVLLFLPQSN